MSRRVMLSLVAASLMAATALAAGCETIIGGKPVAIPASPTEPSFSTPRPTRLPTPTTPSSGIPAPSPPSTTIAPPGGAELSPNAQGYVYIETKSGKTRCQISRDAVGCEAPFTNSPIMDGERANGVHVTAGGTVRWIVGNLGDIPVITLDYRRYEAQGWTIDASSGGTRFSNDGTGHGMFVSIEKVESF